LGNPKANDATAEPRPPTSENNLFLNTLPGAFFVPNIVFASGLDPKGSPLKAKKTVMRKKLRSKGSVHFDSWAEQGGDCPGGDEEMAGQESQQRYDVDSTAGHTPGSVSESRGERNTHNAIINKLRQEGKGFYNSEEFSR
jgi:hypothetical protein